jgi:hypothetical protein
VRRFSFQVFPHPTYRGDVRWIFEPATHASRKAEEKKWQRSKDSSPGVH